MSKKNLLHEAIADAKDIREAALANAQSVLMEHLKENVRATVEEQLSDALGEGEDCVTKEDVQMTENENELNLEELPEVAMSGDDESEDEEGGDDEDSFEADEDSEDEDEDLDEGLTEADLEEALSAALTEVDHGQLGDTELMVNGEKNDHGIADEDTKEAGWETKKAPKAKATTLATGEKYQQENKQLRSKVVQLAKENVLYKKANQKLEVAIKETKLFNAKVLYSMKLVKEAGLTASQKDSIVNKIDGAKSLDEVKTLFEAYKTAFGSVSEKAQAKKVRPSLAEALGSNGNGGKGVSNVSGDSEAKSRFQVLAGIKKE